MYARYIPPPKAKPKVTEEAAPVSVQSGPRPPGTSSIAPYARYIPPPKQQNGTALKPTKIVFGDDDAPPPPPKKRRLDQEDANGKPLGEESGEGKPPNGPSVEIKKVKKEKRERKKENEPQSEVRAEVSGEGDRSSSGATALEQAAREQRKADRKSQKKAKSPKVDSSGPADHGDKLPQRRSSDQTDGESHTMQGETTKQQDRHRGLLEKKAKALRSIKDPARVDKQPADDLETKADKTEAKQDSSEVHGLVPLPQPEPVQPDLSKPTYETLPPWLASPIRVSSQSKASFASLGIHEKVADSLAAKGYADAFAIQVATIPLLLPQVDLQGDLAISAATGSGKTLAYVLPLMQDVSQSAMTRLRALIVVPTRELVRQAQEAFELCASAFATEGRKKVTIGLSVGNQSFEKEQGALMEEKQRYDPAGHEEYLRRFNRIVSAEDPDDDVDMDLFRPPKQPLPGFVFEQHPKVDVLICTPGRLVEHLQKTRGFTLDYVRWFIVDEADKLLGQSFQQWLAAVMPALAEDKLGARHFVGSNKSGVRKVVLSATMTRDISLLNELKLDRPKLIVLEGGSGEQVPSASRVGEYTLPEQLAESAIKIRDADLKPLYLLELLGSHHLAYRKDRAPHLEIDLHHDTREPEAEHSSESESSLSDDSDSDESLAATSSQSAAKTRPRARLSSVLIFTGTNESALRLSRLLSILSFAMGPSIGTLTSATRSTERKKTLQAFNSGRIRVLVASDLVARGIDLPDLDHAINYDIPASVASYVHRVGRTARAGKAGHAWTLLENKQAAWFWREIGGEGKDGSKAIQRNGKIERVKLFSKEEDPQHFSEERIQEYEKALAQLGSEASDGRKKSG